MYFAIIHRVSGKIIHVTELTDMLFEDGWRFHKDLKASEVNESDTKERMIDISLRYSHGFVSAYDVKYTGKAEANTRRYK